MMTNYAKDLHRKGELNKVEEMEKLAKKMAKGKDMGTAFLTEAYFGSDCYALIANSPLYSRHEGYIVYDEDAGKPLFLLQDDEL
jgi:hypothetical protein